MKVKYIGALLLASVLTFFGCDDNTATLGTGMLPGSDGVETHTMTFDVVTNSFAVDSVFARTSTGYIGRFADPIFGYYESSFLTELNCIEDFKFPAVYDGTKKTGIMAGDTVVSIQLAIYYGTWFGDSLDACRMSVYQLNERLHREKDNVRYTNINPEKFYDKFNPQALLGRKAYSAYDASIPDSVRNATDSYGSPTFYPNVTFTLKKDFGNKLLQLNRAYQRGENDYFKNANKFIENVFKGVYIKSDQGENSILYVDRVDLQMQFRFHYVDSTGVALKKKDGTDSLYYSMATVFASTKEVIQANQFRNSDMIKQKAAEKNHTYLKSPAGIFTEATLPYDKINEKLANDTLNAVKLTFTNYNQESIYKFSMSAPSNVLLLRKTELSKDDNFFEKNKLPDNVTSYTISHNNVAANQYTFSNIARLITECINEKNAAKKKAGASWDEAKWTKENPDWDKVLLIPVSITYDSSSSSGGKTMISIQNDLQPGYTMLKGGPEGDALTLEVTYTSFSK